VPGGSQRLPTRPRPTAHHPSCPGNAHPPAPAPLTRARLSPSCCVACPSCRRAAAGAAAAGRAGAGAALRAGCCRAGLAGCGAQPISSTTVTLLSRLMSPRSSSCCCCRCCLCWWLLGAGRLAPLLPPAACCTAASGARALPGLLLAAPAVLEGPAGAVTPTDVLLASATSASEAYTPTQGARGRVAAASGSSAADDRRRSSVSWRASCSAHARPIKQ